MAFEKEPETGTQVLGTEIVKMVNTNTRRIRALEQRLEGTERRLRALQDNFIEEIENLRKKFEQISIDIKAVTENLSKIRAEMLTLNKNFEKTARRAEVKELESLLDLYSPIKSKFTTREEVERMIEEKIEKKTQ